MRLTAMDPIEETIVKAVRLMSERGEREFKDVTFSLQNNTAYIFSDGELIGFMPEAAFHKLNGEQKWVRPAPGWEMIDEGQKDA